MLNKKEEVYMSEKKMMKNGKKLGVVGGLGPAAAAEFLRQFTMRCPANCDRSIL